MAVKIIEVPLPEYHIKEKPDYVMLGKKVDKVVEENLPDGTYLVRAISSDEHPKFNIH